MTKETVFPYHTPPNRPDNFRFDQLNMSFALDDSDIVAALDELFPENALSTSQEARQVEQRSVATDTSDLPPCCILAKTSHLVVRSTAIVSSIGTDTSDLVSSHIHLSTQAIDQVPGSNVIVLSASGEPPSPIMTPPITPIVVGNASEKLIVNNSNQGFLLSESSQFSNPLPDLGASLQFFATGAGENAGLDDSDDDILFVNSTSPSTPPRRNVTFASNLITPPRSSLRMPDRGFSTPHHRKLDVRIAKIVSKTPSSSANRRSHLRGPKVVSSRMSEARQGDHKNPEESRQLRDRNAIAAPIRYIGEHFRSGRASGLRFTAVDTSMERRTTSRSDSASVIKYINCPKPEKESKKGKGKVIVAAPKRQRKQIEGPSGKGRKRKRSSNASVDADEEEAPKAKKKRRTEMKQPDEEREKNEICHTCGKACATVVGLKIHVEVEHLKVRYRCKLCEHVGKMIPSMGQHISRKHPEREYEFKEVVERFTE